MILYVIQAHANLAQIALQIKLLKSDGVYFLVNIDPQASDQIPALEQALQAIGGVDFRIRTGMPVTWGGASQLYSWIDIFKVAAKIGHPWKYLVNLSGDCLPLAPSRRIADHLEEQSRLGKSLHVMRFGQRKHANLFHVVEDPADLRVIAGDSLVKFNGKVSALIDPAVAKIFLDRSRNPTFAWRERGAVHVTDTIISRQLIIRRLLPAEAEQRRAELAKVTLFGGRPWYAIRRDALVRMLADPAFYRIAEMLKNYLCCDELFMQTYMRNTSALQRDEISERNFHFSNGNPGPVSDQILDRVKAAPSFFIRKVKYAKCPALLAFATARVAGEA